MKIVIISDWFAEKMGYAENCLPKALASLGHEVHVITSDAQVYFNSPTYKQTYEPFIGPPIVECEVKQTDGYWLHRLPHTWGFDIGPYKLWRHRLNIDGLSVLLRELRPDVVQTFELSCPTTYVAALLKPILRYQLFLESHMHKSVFVPPVISTRRQRVEYYAGRWLNALVNKVSARCYPISTDAAELAVSHFGISPENVEVCSLGVDTELFDAALGDELREERTLLRKKLGFTDSEVVCVYTGRLTPDKGPHILAQAIGRLRSQGAPFRGLFVGAGTEQDITAIESCDGCVVHEFVPVRDLPPFYRVADIGVWPKQESTSQLDAAACGLPIVLSDQVHVMERIDGNGLAYHEGDPANLASVLLELSDQSLRSEMGRIGAKRMREFFSWNRIARQRAHDYASARFRKSSRQRTDNRMSESIGVLSEARNIR